MVPIVLRDQEMPQLPVDASKFAGMSEEQARSFPRRTVVGEELSGPQVAAMPRMISTDRKRLYGAPLVSVYDIQPGIKGMHRGHDMGLKGAMIWQVPDPRLPFTDPHYEPLWADCAEAEAPVICHILTGHSYIKTGQKGGIQGLKEATNAKTNDSANTLFDFIFSGAFDRHPKLRLLMAESEIGWLPFLLQQWDDHFERFRKDRPMPINRKPSEIFEEHVYGTFLEDYVGTRFFPSLGQQELHVVERLSPLQHDVPPLAQRRRASPQRPRRGQAQTADLGQRGAAVQARRVIPQGRFHPRPACWSRKFRQISKSRS